MPGLDFEGFISQVQARARISQEDARKALDSVLGTLSERISGGEARDLARELPDEVGRHLRKDPTADAASFDAEEFYRRVAERQGVTIDEAAGLTGAVISAIEDSISPQERSDLRSELPAELKALFHQVAPPQRAHPRA